jgi:hypothetical protein
VDVSSLVRINQNFPELDEYNNKKAAYVLCGYEHFFSRPLQITINKFDLFILLSPIWSVQALSLGRKKTFNEFSTVPLSMATKVTMTSKGLP